MIPFPLPLLPGVPRSGSRVPLPEIAEQRLAAFVRHLSLSTHSAVSPADYGRNLRLFLLWLVYVARIDDPAVATREHLSAWQAALHAYQDASGRGYPLATQARKTVVVKAFYRFLVEARVLVIDPSAPLPLAKPEDRLPRGVLTVDEVARLCESFPLRSARDLRDRAILETLYSTGLRRNELIALDSDDVDLSERWVRVVRGKGSKDRVVPLGEGAARWISRYLAEARLRLLCGRTERALFVSTRGRRLRRDGLRRMLLLRARQAGIEKHVTPHLLRHSLATHLLQGGADIRHIQEILGHAKLDTTQVYTRVEIGDLKRVHEQCHPRG